MQDKSARMFYRQVGETKQPRRTSFNLGKSKRGLSTWALKVLDKLCTIVHDCLRLSSFCDESSPLERVAQKGHKCAQF